MKEKIIEHIIDIINERLKIVTEPITDENIKENLLDKGMSFLARDLLMLFCEIEHEFGIKISEAAFERYGFKCIDNMADIVLYEMSKK